MTMDGYFAGGYLPASFLDWDGHVAAVVFTSGCNFRCPWCHNAGLVLGNTEPIPLTGIVKDIESRAKFLDGVVVSGGEPCLWNGLMPFLKGMKELGLPVKLDTNGSMPEVLSRIIEEELVCHVAMDVKAPLGADTLKRAAGVDISPETIIKSIGIVKQSAPSYEFRTTYVPGLLTPQDMISIRMELDDDTHWYVQCFRPVNCLVPEYRDHPAVLPDEVREFLPGINIRG